MSTSLTPSLAASMLFAVLGIAACATPRSATDDLEFVNDSKTPGAPATDDEETMVATSIPPPGEEASAQVSEAEETASADGTAIDGDDVVEGDMLVSSDQARTIAAGAPEVKLWPGGVVPYDVDVALPQPERVRDAAAHWAAMTGIRLVPRKAEPDYLHFLDGGGCYSHLGKRGGRQNVSVGAKCTLGNTMHEIGHAIGIFHEHSRSDRDDFVTVLLANVSDAQASNFRKTTFKGIGTYDFGSIMHYGSFAFSKDGKPTIVKKNGETFTVNRKALSKKDIEGVATLYRAESPPPPPPPPPPASKATTIYDAYLRATPSMAAKSLAIVPTGASLTLTGQTENGYRSVEYEAMKGWVAVAAFKQ